MQSGFALIFFALFAVILVAMYILLRRHIGPVVLVSGGGIGGSIISVFLMTLAQGNTPFWAIVMGLVMGGLFSALAAAAALYFSRNESRRALFDPTQSGQNETRNSR